MHVLSSYALCINEYHISETTLYTETCIVLCWICIKKIYNIYIFKSHRVCIILPYYIPVNMIFRRPYVDLFRCAYLTIYYISINTILCKPCIDLQKACITMLHDYFSKYVSSNYVVYIDEYYISKIMYRFTWRYILKYWWLFCKFSIIKSCMVYHL